MLVGTKPFLHNIANIDSDFIVLLQQLFIVGQKMYRVSIVKTTYISTRVHISTL